MPKGNRKSKVNKKGVKGAFSAPINGALSDNDDVDNASVMSLNSERSFEDDAQTSGISGIYETSNITYQLNESIDSLTEKSIATRLKGLKTLKDLLSSQYIPDILLNQRETICDCLDRIFKKGSSSEQSLAASIFSVLLFQIGSIDIEFASTEFLRMKPLFKKMIIDHTKDAESRKRFIESITLGSFVAEQTLQDIVEVLNFIEAFILANIASEGKNVKILPSAIIGWTLLLTLMEQRFIVSGMNKYMDNINRFLNHSDLEVRLAGGEALTVLVELADLNSESELEMEQDGKNWSMEEIITKLRAMSVESHKYIAKKDRKTQRNNFRDFLKGVEMGEAPGNIIKFGCGEVLELDSWSKKRQYDAICQIFGPGINRHLIENVLVREILELGEVKLAIQDGGMAAKQAKQERQYINSVNFKNRCVNRGRSRDNRMAANYEF